MSTSVSVGDLDTSYNNSNSVGHEPQKLSYLNGPLPLNATAGMDHMVKSEPKLGPEQKGSQQVPGFRRLQETARRFSQHLTKQQLDAARRLKKILHRNVRSANKNPVLPEIPGQKPQYSSNSQTRKKVFPVFSELVCLRQLNFYLRRLWKVSGIGHCAFLAVIVAYAFIGGAIFSVLEAPYEEQAKEVQYNHTYLRALKLAEMVAAMYNDTSKQEALANEGIAKAEIANEKQAQVLELILAYQKELNLFPSNKTLWDLWGALFYAGTLFTTIGYGHYTCQTVEGRVATMLYALFGIPLLMITLQDLGKFLTKWLKIFWAYVCFCRSRRPWPHLFSWFRCVWSKNMDMGSNGQTIGEKSGEQTGKKSLYQKCWTQKLGYCCAMYREQKNVNKNAPEIPADGENEKSQQEKQQKQRQPQAALDNETDLEKFNFPISIAVLLLLVWFFLCSGVFCLWETEWTWFDSFYFFFITLTTIGLGDEVPQHPKFMTAAFVFLIFGLSLVTMVINLIQARFAEIKEVAEDFVEDEILGWDSDSDYDETDNKEKCNIDLKIDQIGIEGDRISDADVGYTVETRDGYRSILGIYQVPVQEKHIKTIVRIRRGTQTETPTDSGGTINSSRPDHEIMHKIYFNELKPRY